MDTPMDISAWRKAYFSSKESTLLESSLTTKDPFKLFDIWFRSIASVKDQLYEEVNAVCVTSVSSEGKPSSRMVLLKSYDDEGFTFFTNYDSRKGHELSANPNAAMLFYWPKAHRQVRVEGLVERLPFSAADLYWNSRPIASRIGSKASQQSTVIPDRQFLENKKGELEAAVEKEGESAASRPPLWGGLMLRPNYFEFWQGQSDRLHDRLVFSLSPPEEGQEYVKEAQAPWHLYRLSP